MTPDASDYVTVAQIAKRLDIDPRTVRRMIDKHEIPGVLRRSRPIRVSREAFERWVRGA